MIEEILKNALNEDIGKGDHSTLSCISNEAKGFANLFAKEEGVLAGAGVVKTLYSMYDPCLELEFFKKDGDLFEKGDILFKVNGSTRSILNTERLVLNILQRMSAIASLTHQVVSKTKHTGVRILDTRKTTPGIRVLEKLAVKIGGGENHRFGLYDMIMLKDNHIDYSGGVKQAIRKAKGYLKKNSLNLKIIVEVRTEQELIEAVEEGGLYRLLLDNFEPEELTKLLALVPSEIETEASGGINLENVKKYAETGVDCISLGALTHSVRSLDLSLKASIGS